MTRPPALRALAAAIALATVLPALAQTDPARPAPRRFERLRQAMADAGRDAGALEMIGGIRGTFADETSVADLGQAAEAIPAQLAAGYTSICFKPSMFTDDIEQVGPLCRELVERANGV